MREPQLGMMVEQFRRGDKSGLGFVPKSDSSHIYGKIGEMSGVKPCEKLETSKATPAIKATNLKDGVFQEQPKAPPKKQVWAPKPNHLKSPLDTLPKRNNERAPPKPATKQTAPKAKKNKSQPKQPQPAPKRVIFHCEFCQKDGHLVEFCFKRKRQERRAREWGNSDLYHDDAVPRRGDRRDVRPRRVGGGGGDGGEYRAPVGGRFDGYVPRRSFNDFGPYHREVERDGFGIPPFGFGGDRRPFERHEMGYGMHGMIDYANPSVEQMTQHWFASHFTNPSVGSFAHPMPYY